MPEFAVTIKMTDDEVELFRANIANRGTPVTNRDVEDWAQELIDHELEFFADQNAGAEEEEEEEEEAD